MDFIMTMPNHRFICKCNKCGLYKIYKQTTSIYDDETKKHQLIKDMSPERVLEILRKQTATIFERDEKERQQRGYNFYASRDQIPLSTYDEVFVQLYNEANRKQIKKIAKNNLANMTEKERDDLYIKLTEEKRKTERDAFLSNAFLSNANCK